MGRPKDVPGWLKRRPITIAEARQAGVSASQLKGSRWRRVGRGVYVWIGLADDPNQRAEALLRRLPGTCVASGTTAARSHGLELDGSDRIEVTVPPGAGVDGGRDVGVRHTSLQAGDICRQRGVLLTSPVRTWFDLARYLPLVDAVAAVDWALHHGKVSGHQLQRYVEAHPGLTGIGQAREVLRLSEAGSESLMESRLRMVLVLAGLPRPRVQHRIGRRRIDLYYPDARLGIEYDGDVHRESLAEDNRRQNWLLARGITLLRFTAADVYRAPEATAAQVGSLLNAGDQHR